jgi:hypothetical protein
MSITESGSDRLWQSHYADASSDVMPNFRIKYR